MGINWNGMAAGFQGYMDEQRRIDDDLRRQKAEARANQDAAFQEEARGRQRFGWREEDRIRGADRADRADISAANSAPPSPPNPADATAANPFGSTPAAPAASATGAAPVSAPDSALPPADAPADARDAAAQASTPASGTTGPRGADVFPSPQIVVAPAAGIPRPRNFNDALANQAELLRRKMARGDLSASDYAAQVSSISRLKAEGVNDALSLMAQGRYDDAMDAFNSTGAMRGARIVQGQEGVTKINGQDTPTHFVTIANADGSRSVVDVAKAQYQLMDLNTQLQHQDRAAAAANTAKYQAGSLKVAQQQTDTQEAYRRDQGEYYRGRNQALIDAAGVRTAGARARLDGKAVANEVKTNAQLYEYTPLNGDKPIEHVAAKSLYTRMIQNPRIGSEQAFDIMAQLKGEAERQSVDPKTGAVDPNKFLPIFNGMVSLADVKMRQASAATSTPAASSAMPAMVVGTGGLAKPAQAVSETPPVRRMSVEDVAERDRRMDLFNRAVGGLNTRREQALAQRRADVDANFASQLGAIKRGMSRADQQRVLSWIDDASEAGMLTNEQLRQVRLARHAAGL